MKKSKRVKAVKFETQAFYVLPVGGCGQFGGNMTFYGYDNQWIAIDCGIAFADERLPGVDLMVPDPSVIPSDCIDRLQGLVITHAHEDHIGGVAHLWPELGYPVLYASEFTAHVLERKFSEMNYDRTPEIIVFSAEERIDFGSLSIIAVPVSHSIPDGFSIFVESEIGTLLHSGDWNMDETPVIGARTEQALFEKYAGPNGVIAYIGDSTNAETEGFSPSEATVADGLVDAFRDAKGRIIITMFSSNISRIYSISKAAEAVGRRVALAGRSLESMARTAKECGLLEDIPSFVNLEVMDSLPHHEQVYIVTGSQGEARASLAKIAAGMHKYIRVRGGDTVMFSARKIPGNERAINDVMNALLSSGVNIVTPKDAPIHVSGHPYKEEIKKMVSWVRPKTVIPVHGEKTQMDAQAKIFSEDSGIENAPNIFVPDNGSLMKITADGKVSIAGRFECAMRPIVFGRVERPDYLPLRDRRKMSFHGCAFISALIDGKNGKLKEFNLSCVGLLDLEREEDQIIYDECADMLERVVYTAPKPKRLDAEAMEEELRIQVRRFFRNLYNVKPVSEVHVIID